VKLDSWLGKLDDMYCILSAEDQEFGHMNELQEFTKEHSITRQNMEELKEMLLERSDNIKLDLKNKITELRRKIDKKLDECDEGVKECTKILKKNTKQNK